MCFHPWSFHGARVSLELGQFKVCCFSFIFECYFLLVSALCSGVGMVSVPVPMRGVFFKFLEFLVFEAVLGTC